MHVSEFDFELPAELIARHPLPNRSASRMLHLDRSTGEFKDGYFRDFPKILRPGDLVVFNNTRVIPARLLGRRTGLYAQPLSDRNPASREFLQGEMEALLTRHLGGNDWQALVRPGRKIGVGERLFFPSAEGTAELEAEVIGRGEFGERTLRFSPVPDFYAALERIGHVPLPPYIDRVDSPEDRIRYQTVYAKDAGSVAAPTAGLHFTPQVLEAMHERGVETTEITLHVGLGTFQPLRHERVEENRLHAERFHISAETAVSIFAAKQRGSRVVAIGTTTVRTLEFVAQQNGGKVVAGDGDAEIFIYPGFRFQIVDALLTNFHLPRSSLLMLVSAFAGREHALAAYRHAVEQRYRFFSYGDCMFIS